MGALADALRGIHARHAGHVNVEKADGRAMFVDQGYRLAAVAGLGDNLELGPRLAGAHEPQLGGRHVEHEAEAAVVVHHAQLLAVLHIVAGQLIHGGHNAIAGRFYRNNAAEPQAWVAGELIQV